MFAPRCRWVLVALLCACAPKAESKTEASADPPVQPEQAQVEAPPAVPEATPEPDEPPTAEADEPPADEPPADPPEPEPEPEYVEKTFADACAALRDELELELGEEAEIGPCRTLASATEGTFSIEVVEVAVVDTVDDVTLLYLAIHDDGDRSFRELSEARDVPGNTISYTLGKPERKGKRFELAIAESDVSFSTDGPRSGKKELEDNSSKTLVCDLAERECEVD